MSAPRTASSEEKEPHQLYKKLCDLLEAEIIVISINLDDADLSERERKLQNILNNCKALAKIDSALHISFIEKASWVGACIEMSSAEKSDQTKEYAKRLCLRFTDERQVENYKKFFNPLLDRHVKMYSPHSATDQYALKIRCLAALAKESPPLEIAKAVEEAKNQTSPESQVLFNWLKSQIEALRKCINTLPSGPGFFPGVSPDTQLIGKLSCALNLELIIPEFPILATIGLLDLLIRHVLQFRLDNPDADLSMELANPRKHPTTYFVVRLLQDLQEFITHNRHPAYQEINNLLKVPLRGLPVCNVVNESIVRSLKDLYANMDSPPTQKDMGSTCWKSSC